MKHLGVFLVADKKIKYTVHHLKIKLFRAFNYLY